MVNQSQLTMILVSNLSRWSRWKYTTVCVEVIP